MPVTTILGKALSWRDIVLLAAGLFLMVQATLEIHSEIDHEPDSGNREPAPRAGYGDHQYRPDGPRVFFNSILTAIGIAKDLAIMVVAILISLAVMYAAATVVARFIHAYPTTKVLALCFLVLIGVSLVAEGWGLDVPRGYLYFAMVFSSGVEALNVWARRNRKRRAGGTPPPPAISGVAAGHVRPGTGRDHAGGDAWQLSGTSFKLAERPGRRMAGGLRTGREEDALERTVALDHARPMASRSPASQANTHGRDIYAALDLGTDNCRLLIARPSPSGLHILDAFSRIVRLGENLSTTGRLSDAATTRTLAALSVCREKMTARR